MHLLSIELARAINSDVERTIRERSRFAGERPGPSRRRVRRRRRGLSVRRIRPAV